MRGKKIYSSQAFLTICATCVVLFALPACSDEYQINTQKACLDNHCFNIEIADTAEKQQRGLQLRETLERDAGMFFIFPNSQNRRFWMKDTLIPLDMIWIDTNMQIVDITHSAPPCKSDPCPTYSAQQPVQYVLEINAGSAREMGINIGDTLHIK